MECMRLTEHQTKVLEESYKKHRCPDQVSLMLIAAETGLSEVETEQWFKQRNSKWRQAEGLPAELGSVLD
ncbi:homeodomain-only protein [Corythoichthys intestinalis]|uniref:homeodomain-only protein n=1 Tax=Corythoichthys intestinalis TaxID=161448 RepID=UPI0025A63D17|nr:homeodomain-only protein [Corythoichthys intestinalis]